VLLRDGELIASDSPRKVVEQYLSETFPILPQGPSISPTRVVDFVSLEFVNPDGASIRTGDPMLARFTYSAHRSVTNVAISASFYWPSGYLCAQLTTAGKLDPLTLKGTGIVEFFCRKLVMQRGLYSVDVAIELNGEVIEQYSRCAFLRVDPGMAASGDFYQEHSAEIKEAELESYAPECTEPS
jgi:hypothetical protein